jgi:hypothetical protein
MESQHTLQVIDAKTSNLGLFSSTAEVSGFLKYKLPDQRNSTALTYGDT